MSQWNSDRDRRLFSRALAVVAITVLVSGCQAHNSANAPGPCASLATPADCTVTGSLPDDPAPDRDYARYPDTSDLEDEATIVEGNPTVEAARQAIPIADGEVSKAWAGIGPRVSATGSVDWQDEANAGPGSTAKDGQSIGVKASLPIRDSLFGRPKVRSARASARAAALGFKSDEQDVILEMAQILAQIERDRAVLKALDQHIARLNGLLRDARDRAHTGDMSATDVSQIRLKVVSARADRADAEASLAESLSRLPTVIGSSGEATLRDVSRVLPGSQAAIVSAALANSPGLLAAREEETAAQEQLSASRGEFLPEVNLNATAARRYETGNRAGDDDLYVGVSIDMPLYDGGERSADVRQKEAALRERGYRAQSLERATAARVKADWAKRQSARSKLALSSERIAAARAALDGVGKARLIGARTIEDELNAASDLLTAIISRSEAKKALVLAEHRLAAEAGVLSAAYRVNG